MKDHDRYNLTQFYIVNVMVLFILCVGGGVLLLNYFSDQALDKQGITTQATVVDLFTTTTTSKNSTKSLNYQITYQFHPQNKTKAQFTTARITAETYTQLQIGSNINIRYLPDNPAIARISGDEEEQNFRNLLLIITVLAAFSWVGITLAIVKLRRKHNQAYYYNRQALHMQTSHRQNFH